MALCMTDTGIVYEGNRRECPGDYQRLWRAFHQEENNQYHREYHHRMKDTPAYHKMKAVSSSKAQRKMKTGWTPEQYTRALTAQGGRCSICGEWYGTKLRADHDHETGDTRELLCDGCNQGLGRFKDDPSRLMTAIEYLKRHSKNRS